jgi:hypothetical protein
MSIIKNVITALEARLCTQSHPTIPTYGWLGQQELPHMLLKNIKMRIYISQFGKSYI